MVIINRIGGKWRIVFGLSSDRRSWVRRRPVEAHDLAEVFAVLGHYYGHYHAEEICPLCKRGEKP